MFKLRDFLELLEDGYRIDLYINDKLSVSCDVDSFLRTEDIRGNLPLTKK